MGNREEKNYCEWIYYDSSIVVPRWHEGNNVYWRVPVSWNKLKYCPYCGKRIKLEERV